LKLSFGNVTFLYKNKLKNTESIQPTSNKNSREQLLLQPKTYDVPARKNQDSRENSNFFQRPAKSRLKNRKLLINEVSDNDFRIPEYERPFSNKNLRKQFLLRRRKKVKQRKRKMQERNQGKFEFSPMHSGSRMNNKRISINRVHDPDYTSQESIEPFSNLNYRKQILLQSRNKVLRKRKLKKPFTIPTPSEISYDKSTISVNEVNHEAVEEQSPYDSYDVSYDSNPLSQTMILV